MGSALTQHTPEHRCEHLWHESAKGAYFAVCSCGHETTRETLTDKTLSTIDNFAAHVLSEEKAAIKERLLSDEAVETICSNAHFATAFVMSRNEDAARAALRAVVDLLDEKVRS